MRPRRGVFWPLLLIAVGLVFLLQNFGFISGVSWLALLSLWPLLLVLIGLDIAFARRWPLPTLTAEVLVIAAGLALLAYEPTGLGLFVIGDHDENGTTDISVARGEATSLALTLNAGATRAYRVSGGADGLVEAHSANPDLRQRGASRAATAARAEVRIDEVSPSRFVLAGRADIQVKIASDVPTSFVLNAGAGEFDVDLSEVRVTDARVNVGASSTRLVLPAKPNGDVAVRINGGASTIVVTVPDGVEARISTSGGLLSLRSDNARLGPPGSAQGCVACGSSIETSRYASVRDRVTVTIAAGASSIVVR